MSPSVSLKEIVTNVLDGLAPFVLRLALVLVNVIVGAVLSVMLTVKVP